MKVQNNNLRSRQGFTLVEMLGVLAIIAILISVIAVGVLSAINRARVVATVANLKNIETGVTGYVALANSGGTLPLTESNGGNSATTAIPTVDNNGTITYTGTGAGYVIDQVLLSSGLQEKPLSWRVGTDGTTLIDPTKEPKFLLSKRAFSTTITQTGAAGTPALNATNWPTVNRVECSAIGSAIPTASPMADTDFITAPQFAVDGTSLITAGRVVYVVLKGVSLKDAQKLSQELNGALDNTEITAGVQRKGRFIFDAGATPGATVDCFYYIASF